MSNLAWKERVINTTEFEPLGRAILVEPWEPEEKAKSVIELPKWVKDQENTRDVIVRVLAVGPHAWPDEPQRAFPGDIVFVAKYSGSMHQGRDGKTYRFVTDRDIFARVRQQEQDDE